MTIAWLDFFVVLLASVFSACGLIALYSLGLRLYLPVSRTRMPTQLQRGLGVACFVLCALGILFGVYLIVVG